MGTIGAGGAQRVPRTVAHPPDQEGTEYLRTKPIKAVAPHHARVHDQYSNYIHRPQNNSSQTRIGFYVAIQKMSGPKDPQDRHIFGHTCTPIFNTYYGAIE